MNNDSFKKLKELIKIKKELNKLDKLQQKDNKDYEKDRKVFERNSNKAAKTIINNTKKNDDPLNNA